jgi:nicotinamidase-related amidase
MLVDPPGGVPSAATIRHNISHILEEARFAKPTPLIIHVRNTGEKGDPDEPNTLGWQLVFAPLTHEPIVDKLECNAFAGTNLGELVTPDAEIVVVGLQSEYCIRATCMGGLERGNRVVLVRGAHFTYDARPDGNGVVKRASMIEEEIERELKEAGAVLVELLDVPSILTRM